MKSTVDFQAALGAADAALEAGSIDQFMAASDVLFQDHSDSLAAFDGEQPAAGVRLTNAIRAAASQIIVGGRRAALFGVPISGAVEQVRTELRRGHLTNSIASALRSSGLMPEGFEVAMLRFGVGADEILHAGPSRIRSIAEEIGETLNATTAGRPSQKNSVLRRGAAPRKNTTPYHTVVVLGVMVAPAGWVGQWIPNNPLGMVAGDHVPPGISTFLKLAQHLADTEVEILPPGDWDTCMLQVGMADVDRALLDEGTRRFGDAFIDMAQAATQSHLFIDPTHVWIAKQFGSVYVGPQPMALTFATWRPRGILGMLAFECEAIHTYTEFTGLREAIGPLQ